MASEIISEKTKPPAESGGPPPSPSPVIIHDSPLLRHTGSFEAVGWPYVANFMTTQPDLQAFPRFQELNVKDLLYYQVEISQLSHKLRNQEMKDWKKRGMNDAGKYAKFADELVYSQSNENHKQWDLILKMRGLLREYNTALLQFAQVSALSEPDSYSIKNFVQWLTSPDAGNFCIGGMGSDVWGDLYTPPKEPQSRMERILSIFRTRKDPKSNLDLVAIRPPQKLDGFTRWVVNDFAPVFHRLKTSCCGIRRRQRVLDAEGGTTPAERRDIASELSLRQKRQRLMLKLTSLFVIFIACLLPTVAIIVLSKVPEEDAIYYLVGFTAIFAVGLMLFTNSAASKVEIFTVTAAFSAVMVVFIR